MKAEEMRIGNIVSYKGEPARVTMIGQYGIQALGTDNVINAKFGTPDIEPIPLTPEILEKAGFVVGPMDIWVELRDGRFLCFTPDFSECYLQFEEGFGVILYNLPSIKYVHQLQNLYYSLVGSELSLNL